MSTYFPAPKNFSKIIETALVFSLLLLLPTSGVDAQSSIPPSQFSTPIKSALLSEAEVPAMRSSFLMDQDQASGVNAAFFVGDSLFQEILQPVEMTEALERLSSLGEAVFVIVRGLSEEDIGSLLRLRQEVGIAVLYGQIVLFTSGETEILNLMKTGNRFDKEASFLAHTHPGTEKGPSSWDLEMVSDQPEYVITNTGEVIEYDRFRILQKERPISYLVKKVRDAVTASPLTAVSYAEAAVTWWARKVVLTATLSDHTPVIYRVNLKPPVLEDRNLQARLPGRLQDMAEKYFKLWKSFPGEELQEEMEVYFLDSEYSVWLNENHTAIQQFIQRDPLFRDTFLEIIFYRISIANRVYG